MCRQGWGIRNVTGPESGDIGQHSSFRKSRKVGHPAARYQDSNIWSERKLIEELRYMHRNPLGVGAAFAAMSLVLSGAVEIESQWTAPEEGGLG